MSEADRTLIRATGSMAGGTIVSRATGMVRNTMLIAAIGTGVFSDTFTVANTVPNIVYILLVGGALNAVFIPQLVKHMRDDGDEGTAYAQRLITATGLVLLVITALAVVLAPWIVRLYGSAEWSTDDFDTAVTFARLCLPQIFFYGVYAMLSQVLNARDRFAWPMYAPVVNNVVVIASSAAFLALVADPPTTGDATSWQLTLLGLGATAGVVAQAAVLVPVLRRAGFRYRPRFDLRGQGLGTAAHLAKWTVLFVLTNQLAYIVITRLATTAGKLTADAGGYGAGFTVYSTAHLIFLLPHSIITVSLVTALLPRMSREAHEGSLHLVRRDVARGVNLATAAMLPAAALLLLLGPRIGVLLFNYGNSTFEDARYLGVVVSAFALGLPAFSAYYVLLRGYYALEDTRTPFTVNVVLNLVNVALALAITAALPPERQVAGLAVAYSAAYWLALALSWLVLRGRLGGLETYQVVRTAVRVSIATGVAAALGVALLQTGLVPSGSSLTPLTALVSTAVIGSVVGGAYLLVARRLRVRELDVIVEPVLSRLRRR